MKFIIEPFNEGQEMNCRHEIKSKQAIKGISAWDIGRLVTHDYREDSPAEFHGDYISGIMGRTIPKDFQPDIVITNPPFAIACEVIEQALSDVRKGGLVMMLLRLNFYGGTTDKKVFFDKIGLPVAAYVHRKRMSFTADGKTDSIEYQHAIWQSGNNPKFTKMRII